MKETNLRMKIKWTGLALVALSMMLANTGKANATPAAIPSLGIGQEMDHGGWDAPPQEFRDVQRQGFHDGIGAARHDFESHHRKDIEDHGDYRHPHVAHELRADYREGFRQGYERAMSHLNDVHDHDHN